MLYNVSKKTSCLKYVLIIQMFIARFEVTLFIVQLGHSLPIYIFLTAHCYIIIY